MSWLRGALVFVALSLFADKLGWRNGDAPRLPPPHHHEADTMSLVQNIRVDHGGEVAFDRQHLISRCPMDE